MNVHCLCSAAILSDHLFQPRAFQVMTLFSALLHICICSQLAVCICLEHDVCLIQHATIQFYIVQMFEYSYSRSSFQMFTNGSQKLQSFKADIFFSPPFSGYFTRRLYFKTWKSQRSHSSDSNGGLQFERSAVLQKTKKNCPKPAHPWPVVRREA